MAEESKKIEKKAEEQKAAAEEPGAEAKAAEKVEEKKPAAEEKKPEAGKKTQAAKERAIAKGNSMRVSMKHCKMICRMIKGKSPEEAVEMLEQVLAKKRIVPMNSMEIPHRKGRGLMAGRYPKNASVAMINLIKQLGANSNVAGIEEPVITLAIANEGSRPYKREGRRSKRTNVLLEAKSKHTDKTGKPSKAEKNKEEKK